MKKTSWPEIIAISSFTLFLGLSIYDYILLFKEKVTAGLVFGAIFSLAVTIYGIWMNREGSRIGLRLVSFLANSVAIIFIVAVIFKVVCIKVDDKITKEFIHFVWMKLSLSISLLFAAKATANHLDILDYF